MAAGPRPVGTWLAPPGQRPRGRPAGPPRIRGDACHQSCAEDEIARELLGTGRTLIDDERIPTPARTLEVSS
ncbi:hypothetical protein [Micromonospora sediminicola]|uniref:hypothetical protein n=1 Tax=Micromonospora sediminicola TaxID=946078 RepID=UPI000A516DB4|nr:hypothetical protein [Micromonospora sediminicola]